MLGLEERGLDRLRKGAMEKKLLAWLVTRRAMVSSRWVAERLKMGVAANVGKYAGEAAGEKRPLRGQTWKVESRY